MNDRITPESVFSERDNDSTTNHQNTSGNNKLSTWALVVGIALVTGVGGFIGGMQVNSSSATAPSSNTAAAGGQANGRPGAGAMGTLGTVTAISDTSITVNDTMQNTSKTFTLNSSTTVTESGTSSSIDSIAVGDLVAVQTDTATADASSSDSSSAAKTIELNPTIPSGGARQQR